MTGCNQVQRPVTSCTCKDCVGACRTSPGWFLPGEAETAASHLGLPFSEFRDRFLVVVRYEGVEMYAPAKVTDPGGCQAVEGRSYLFERADCVFLQDERCSIHPAKPYECRVGFVCRPGGGGPTKAEIVEAWR